MMGRPYNAMGYSTEQYNDIVDSQSKSNCPHNFSTYSPKATKCIGCLKKHNRCVACDTHLVGGGASVPRPPLGSGIGVR